MLLLIDKFAFVGVKFFNDVVYISVQNSWHVAAAIPDTVVSYAVLGEVIGTNFFATIATAN